MPRLYPLPLYPLPALADPAVAAFVRTMRDALVAKATLELQLWQEDTAGFMSPARYWRKVNHNRVPRPAPGKRIHWCGAFVLSVFVDLAVVDWAWSFHPRRPGFVWRVGRPAPRGYIPRPADICVVHRAWHHALVVGPPEAGLGDSRLIVRTIDGNAGPAPGRVSWGTRLLASSGVDYYDTTDIIAAAAERLGER